MFSLTEEEIDARDEDTGMKAMQWNVDPYKTS